MSRRGFEVGVFTDPHQTQMFFDIMQQIFEPKVSRKARQTREALEQLAKMRKEYGYVPEFERQYASTFHYDPGLFRRIFRPSERQPELLFSPYEPDLKIKQPKSGRLITPPITTPLPPPTVEPLIHPEHKREITELAKELYPDDTDAQRDFISGMITKRWPTTEDKRYQAIGKVEELINTLKSQHKQSPETSHMSDDDINKFAQQQAQQQMPRAFAIWKDFHLTNELKRQELESRTKTREEELALKKARQRLAEERFKWEQQLNKHREDSKKSAQNVRNALQAYNLAQKAWRDEMALRRSYKERQDKIKMDLLKLGYAEDPTFEAFALPEYSFNEWLHTPTGSFWRDLIDRLGGLEQFKQRQPTVSPPPPLTPPAQRRSRQPTPEEERMRQKYGFSPYK